VKKLDYNHLTTGALTVDASHLIGVVNDLIDLVNSQQEAIGELQTEIGVLRNMVLQSQEAIEKLQEHVDHEARHVSEPTDDKPGFEVQKDGTVTTATPDTNRTVTLRIPKDMTVGEAIVEIYNDYRVANHQMDMWLDDYLVDMSDTDLQKALDEIQPNE